MTSVVPVRVLENEPEVEGAEIPEEEMQEKPQGNGFGFSIANVAIAIMALILGVVGGLLASVATNSEWKGKMEQRIEGLEKQRAEDKVTWDYIRTQNEVNGKILTQIQAELSARKGR
jgi:hypothetical protein